MSFSQSLLEMLYDPIGYKGPEVFKNPTRQEVSYIMDDSVYDGARFAVDTNGNIFGWVEEVLHSDMEKFMGKKWVVKMQYTNGHHTLWLSSGSNRSDWKKAGGDVLIDFFTNLLPNLISIEMQSRPYSIIWAQEE